MSLEHLLQSQSRLYVASTVVASEHTYVLSISTTITIIGRIYARDGISYLHAPGLLVLPSQSVQDSPLVHTTVFSYLAMIYT